ncbi:hypothetical protein HELRODRAFT_167786 [Helobdella robusta]|uniref:Uncharacterized protein n=1 Tax=Helobdella robusta TaxID=6412 RepID=T1EZT1_HELRO|nr:hypothetical protein HELRODRAFT_167786 [Helobdella robusta]ESO09956.1 hypothetical protein HELRODRAFT_167786 [Helobdella robusta]
MRTQIITRIFSETGKQLSTSNNRFQPRVVNPKQMIKFLHRGGNFSLQSEVADYIQSCFSVSDDPAAWTVTNKQRKHFVQHSPIETTIDIEFSWLSEYEGSVEYQTSMLAYLNRTRKLETIDSQLMQQSILEGSFCCELQKDSGYTSSIASDMSELP